MPAPPRPSYQEMIERRRELIEEVKSRLGPESLKKARLDYHARRAPRPCGMTIHPATGCPNACLYCYIQDMGFGPKAEPYPLSGLELAAALLANKYFIPGLRGTYLAFGSITEPFLPHVTERTLEYMEALSELLGNPIQFSTKMPLSDEVIERLRRLKAPVSPLVTIVTLAKHRKLEPRAPSPWERLETLRRLSKAGLRPFLFLRPVIPGINDDELEDIIAEAKRYGAEGVVIGGFRITRTIARRLEAAGFDLSQILSRIPRLPAKEQVPVPLRGLKERLLGIARERGLRAVLNACCAMTNVAVERTRLPCANACFSGTMCAAGRGCPLDCAKMVPEVDEDDVRFAAKDFLGVDAKEIEVRGFVIRILARERPRRRDLEARLNTLTVLYRRRVILEVVGA